MQRREFMKLLSATVALPYASSATAPHPLATAPHPLATSPHPLATSPHPFRVRTVTAGVPLMLKNRDRQLGEAAAFLGNARSVLADQGYEVQTLRIATQPLPEYLSDWLSSRGLQALVKLDEFCERHDVILSIGPVIDTDRFESDLADWAADMIGNTRRISFSVGVASADIGIHPNAIRSAAQTIAAIARRSLGGEGNFRFAATANCPPGTPFFPAAWHRGEASFAIGLETPPLLLSALKSLPENAPVARHIAAAMNAAFAPLQAQAEAIARRSGRRYLGIDTSPAPGPDASIGQVIETLTRTPFGSASTLSACAEITAALKLLEIKTCGYSGLMLPVLEDTVLATRAAEGRYGLGELLLYSSVCGTGLDVVPLPGDSSAEALAAVIGDVAALSARYQKPLSARLFPIPGKKAGDLVSFDNPFLTDSVIMKLD